MPETLYLIDGHAQIFRAYFAIRGGMRSPVTGESTHAVFGFAGMLFKLFSQNQPHYVAVAVDAPGTTFRDDLYEAYKGTRQSVPDDLPTQVPRVIELVEGFGLPVLSIPGLEADDVIATVTQRILDDPSCADVHIRIVSKDKDLEQLLCHRVCLFDIHTDTLLNEEHLLANKGITPAQVVDLLTLTGDSVDNVPGVDGIGPKTAAQLLQQFGTLDNLLANLDQLKGKRRENLEAARAHIPLSRKLVTLVRDAEFPFTLESARVKAPNLHKLLPLFQQLGFNRYQDEVCRVAALYNNGVTDPLTTPSNTPDENPDTSTNTPLEGHPGISVTPNEGRPGVYRAVCTREELRELVTALRAAPLVSVDTETTGLGKDAKLCGFALAWEREQGVYVPVRSPQPETHLDEKTVLEALQPLLEDPSLPKCGHNLKFDARILRRAGVHLRGITFDTMLAAMLLDPSQGMHKLDHLAQTELGYQMTPIEALIGTGEGQLSMDQVPLEQMVRYAAEDADIALRLVGVLQARVEATGMAALLREVEAPLSGVLAEMELNGILCDPEELKRQGQALGARVEELRAQVYAAAGCEFHLDSPKQLAEVLFDRLGMPVVKKTKTGRSTDIEVLERLAAQESPARPESAVPRLVIEYRQLAKLISTYLGNLADSVDADTGRIHSTFHQLLTATGRLASHGPNLQNIPVRSDVGRQIRKAFHAPEGSCLICADYSQVELRLLAHLSEDPALVRAFEADLDIHTAVAAEVFGVPLEEVSREQRGQAKTINFGIIYGVTPSGLARRIGGLDVTAAAKLIDSYRERFSGIDRFLQQCIRHALEHGYVSTLLGRRRAIPEITSINRTQRSLGERLAINSVVQGSAADLIKVAMVNVQRRIDRERLPLRLLLQIHDELVFETPQELAAEHASLLCEEMERALALRVPLKAEAGIGQDWMTAK